ncbi:MAG: polyhydroxybutyrate depolymerase [Gammaproteobacteria bacterium]|nr:polyhydroxybutyrate depolymerase [Gammaproteobacteria bacterium]MBU1482654.1 polyhydroxybutyrate depolymerase [Gammaproteobacteria bacterium]
MSIFKQLAIAILFLSALVAGTAHAGKGETRHLSDGSRDRTYLLYRPAQLSRLTPVPLVIMLHGGFGSGSQAESAYDWDEKADAQGFVVAYPNGIARSWNAGGICCGPALRKKVDDLGFLTRLIDAVSQSENIDAQRVYIAGMSNGAAMAYRYACEGTYPIAAIGPVAGSFSYPCPKPHPVSVIAIHGLNDQHIPFAGGQGSKGVTNGAWASVPQTLDGFRAVNDCQPPVAQKQGLVHTDISSCEQGREIVLITIDEAGHQWPGGKARKGIVQRLLSGDPPSTTMDATAALWNFFQRHTAQH